MLNIDSQFPLITRPQPHYNHYDYHDYLTLTNVLIVIVCVLIIYTIMQYFISPRKTNDTK
jgi:hypothetical protein